MKKINDRFAAFSLVNSETITMRYIGSLNFNHLIRGCLSTDGKFLFAGSEDAIVHVWNVDTGRRKIIR